MAVGITPLTQGPWASTTSPASLGTVTVSAGSYLLIVFYTGISSSSFTSVSDSASGTWTSLSPSWSGNNNNFVILWRTTPGTGASITITASFSGTPAASRNAIIDSVSNASGSISSPATATVTGNVPASVTTPASINSGDLFFSVTSGSFTGTPTSPYWVPSSGFTLSSTTAGSGRILATQYQIASTSAQTVTASGSLTGTGSFSSSATQSFVIYSPSYFEGWGSSL